MTRLRESTERATRRHSHARGELTDLAIAIVKDDPTAKNSRLASRWMAQVQGDRDLLETALTAQAEHEIVMARNFLDRQTTKGKHGKATQAKTEKKKSKAEEALGKKMVMKLGQQILGFVAENGKKIRDLTGTDLEKLESDNAQRANLYRELRKRVKGNAIVGETLGEEQFRSILQRIGDVDQLGKLFG